MTREEFMALVPELVNDYQPSEGILKVIGNLSLLMIIGPTGSGKTTLIKKTGIPYIPSDTTRPPRPEEVEGIDYNFRSDYEALIEDIKNGRFVQVAIGSGGDFYGTRGSSYPNSGMGVMAVVADVIPIFRNLGFRSTISAFITPPSYGEWQRRMGGHDLSGKQLSRRLMEAERSFNFALTDLAVHLILNDDLGDAHQQLNDLINGRADVEREKMARKSVRQLLVELKTKVD